MNSTEGVSIFRSFLEESGCIELRPVEKDILIQSAHISAQTGMKTPDAIHVATAMASGCDIFLTNDKAIQTHRGLERVLLTEYSDL